ncbi:Splicing factor 1 [Monocercomonoides exilis]|uniref:Splicing factor 1 n=1 Tax=Monocercomonoides exilis TaxID=2049356 RepID=UPI00355A0D5C|nr:Splicing factor 1 [Monocercomonoides exilis]|eukprot:MONOS_29.1-p1 / transcript=MONOS_29.1 / gene=MONOS_29 / organism=Monocercomonoides_exilis_PA203 / gene_product=Splicing factor 1 / transcript_product=Splicing factor 1 / location=Mono_scaffold00001:77704-78132(+) / protein_length=143 / sequence_SO=supercontig / SO=protein_coding / is_pseudo=false
METKVAPRKYRKHFLPEINDPHLNVLGLRLGTRGQTLKEIEATSHTKITFRGKGSNRTKREVGKIYPGSDEKLHAYIQADTDEQINAAVTIIDQLLMHSDMQNEFRRQQLRELAKLNGTDMSAGTQGCSICDSMLHSAEECS